MTTVVALDVGGTGIKAAVVRDRTPEHEITVPTPVAEGPDAVVSAIRQTVANLIADAGHVDAVGVIAPGPVDAHNGVLISAVNMGWHNVPMRQILQQQFGLPAAVEHDVRAAGLAERVLGRTRGIDDAFTITIGTGIAGLIIARGEPIIGAKALGGEIGHAPVHPEGELCPCGSRGCLERYASASAIARRYQALTGRAATAAECVARLHTDPAARRVWDDATTALGLALATYTTLLDPALIVLGGGLANAGTVLRDPVRAELARRVTWRDVPPVELSPLGSRAGLLGAALVAEAGI
jgi:glucokinase